MNRIIILLFSLFWLVCLNGQNSYVVGYQEVVSGNNFTYHSPLSNSEACLLIRANKDFQPIVWNTRIVPPEFEEDEISFVWLYGMDVTPTPQTFVIWINDQRLGSFQSPVSNNLTKWTIEGDQGYQLTFHKTMVDRHGDQMGFAVLTVPASIVVPGEAAQIKIEAIDKDSQIWFMTYKVPLEEDITIKQLGVVTKAGDEFKHVARIKMIHLGDPVNSTITIGDQRAITTLIPGVNEVDFLLPAVADSALFTAKIETGVMPATYHTFWLAPVKEWTIYLVQHSHTDIGYTRSQTEILAEHLRYIDFALDFCDQTDDYPEEAKFRWTCEAAWTVREYLKARPESQINRLLQRIKEGRIEVTGMFFNYSEVVDETSLAMQTQTLTHFKEKGIEVSTAMQNDVNGIGWCMVDLFNNTGVKYLIMGQHGHRAQIPFDKPTAFWWESPAGNRLLAYRSEHYMHGNSLGLTTGNIDVFSANLSNYLEDLERKNYPFNHTAFQFSGYVTDNSPPSTIACDIVKEWNEKYEWPKLKISLAREFMTYLDEHEGAHLPVKQVAWPDWWSDGFGSAMNETKAARSTHAEMIGNMGLFSMARLLGADIPDQINVDIRDCYDNLLFYDEHTFGADVSISDPMTENVIVQWGQKSAYAWSAVKQSGLLKEKALGYLQPFIPKSDVPTIAVFNTLNWKRSGLAEVYIDHQILPLDKDFKILDEGGNTVDAHLMSSRNDGSYWSLWVSDIPAMGYALLRVEVNSIKIKSGTSLKPENQLENNYYKITIDAKRGAVSHIYDKELNLELVDQECGVKLGALIYEELENRHVLERLTGSNRDTTYVPLRKQLHSLEEVQVSEVIPGELWNSVRITGSLEKCSDESGVQIEMRLYHHEKKIELLYATRKLNVSTPEGLYVAFPFTMTPSGELSYEVQGGTVHPGFNQLEGTSSDWNLVQNFVSVRNQEAQIVFSSKSTPLVQFGEINTGHFYYTYQPEKTHLYSWVLNNYWTTNFKASQEGGMSWNYFITSMPNNSNAEATRFGWENRIPLAARVIPSGAVNDMYYPRSVLNIDVPNLLLVDSQLASTNEAIVLHLRETEGDQAMLDVDRLKRETKALSISEVNVLGEEIQVLTKPLLFEKFETKFILLQLE